MEDLPDPLYPVAVADDLVQARAANLAGSALGLRPAVHEFVARLRLPLPHERDLDHNKDPLEPMPSWGLRVTVPAVLGAIHSCGSAPSLRRSVGPGGSRRCPVLFSDPRREPRDPRPHPG